MGERAEAHTNSFGARSLLREGTSVQDKPRKAHKRCVTKGNSEAQHIASAGVRMLSDRPFKAFACPCSKAIYCL